MEPCYDLHSFDSENIKHISVEVSTIETRKKGQGKEKENEKIDPKAQWNLLIFSLNVGIFSRQNGKHTALQMVYKVRFMYKYKIYIQFIEICVCMCKWLLWLNLHALRFGWIFIADFDVQSSRFQNLKCLNFKLHLRSFVHSIAQWVLYVSAHRLTFIFAH